MYFDPPYRPLSITSGFTSYTKEDFNDANQKELANYFGKLDVRNAKLMLSNSNPKNTNENDDFFENIYKGFNINEISAKRMINCNSKGREKFQNYLLQILPNKIFLFVQVPFYFLSCQFSKGDFLYNLIHKIPKATYNIESTKKRRTEEWLKY